MKVGLIGCGSIGKFLLDSINTDGLVPGCRIHSAFDGRSDRFDPLVKEYGIEIHHDIRSFLDSGLDLVIESANIQAVRDYAGVILESGKNLIIISVGALVDNAFYDQLAAICRKSGAQIFLPSGAIGGLDVLKAAAVAKQLDSVSITTRKPARSLVDEPLEAEKVLFEGPAAEAIALFPKNINVSIILSLVGLGPIKTSVKIIADPHTDKNNHYIEAAGAFGKLKLHVENDPMPNNPKTSYLAALSILSTLSNQNQNIHIG